MYDMGIGTGGEAGMSEDAQRADAAVDSADALDTEIDAAFALLQDGLARLLEIGDRGDFCGVGPARLIALAQRFERHRSRWGAVDTAIVEAAREERLDAYTCSRSLPIALADALRISRATAKARVARAEQLMPEHAFSTGTATAQHPVLADAVRAGAVTGDQVSVIGPALRRLRTNPQVGPEELQQAEQVLVEHAAAFGPEQLRVVAARIDDVLLPDGVLPREGVARARRGVSLGPERRDGTHSITGSLTRSAYARVMSVLSPLAAPRPADDALGPDPRTAPQRLHDALEDAMARLLDSAGLPRSGGTPATVHVIIDIDQLRAALTTHTTRTGNATTGGGGDGGDAAGGDGPRPHRSALGLGPTGRPAQYCPTRAAASTSFGDQLTFPELIELAEQARIIPTYLSATHGIVAYGARRRCATPAQTQALITRDHGCSFPGCDAPPEWCERHHVIPWYRGGPTDLNNLTLLCGYHHREHATRGWQVTIHHGLPVWIPPTWIDRHRTPLLHARIRATTPTTGDLQHLDAATVLAAAHATEHALTTTDTTATRRADDRTDNNGRLPAGLLHDPEEALDELDPIPDLLNLLAQHITTEEREEFHYDLNTVLDSYLGPNAPKNRHLEPVA
jgi:hypothetical protein